MTLIQVQLLLNFLGYDTEGVDGICGPKTKKAVLAFQKDFDGLTVDGIPGEETQKALRHAVAFGIQKREEPEEDVPESGTGDEWDEIEHFVREEFKCTCGGRYCDGFPAEPQEAMVRLAQAARTHFGRPVTVVSGLRCAQHNANVGGVEDSQHMYGEACDIYVSGVAQSTVLSWFLAQPGVRYAYAIENSSNVHFDIPKGDR